MIKKFSTTAVFCLLALGLFGCDDAKKANEAASAPATTTEASVPATNETSAPAPAVNPVTNGSETAPVSSSIEECDQYFAAVDKMLKELPDNQKALFSASYDNFKKLIKEHPEQHEQTRAGCKQALEALPPQFR